MSLYHTIITYGADFGCDVNNDATVVLGFLWRLKTKPSSSSQEKGGKVLGHHQWTHCVCGQSGNYALRKRTRNYVKYNSLNGLNAELTYTYKTLIYNT